MAKAKSLNIGNVSIQPGERISLALPSPELYTCAPIHTPVHVLHGKSEGPILVICAAMHGDEMNGISIIQKILGLNLIKNLKGTLIAIPIMNVYGLVTKTCSMPGGRRLDDAFPGLEKGSYAERLAFILSKEIFSLATHCIEFRTGSSQLRSSQQILTRLNNPTARDMAYSFQIPIIEDTDSNKGLLHLMDLEKPIPTIIYESGEPSRLDVEGINKGIRGVVRVMRALEMLPPSHSKHREKIGVVETITPVLSHSSGLCRFYLTLGNKVKRGELIARVSDPFSTKRFEDILSPSDGYIISETILPLVNEGDMIVKIAQLKEAIDITSQTAETPSNE